MSLYFLIDILTQKAMWKPMQVQMLEINQIKGGCIHKCQQRRQTSKKIEQKMPK